MLALEEWIAESDDDLEIWASVTVGFDDDKNFIVMYEYVDYEEESNNYVLKALIGLQDASRLSDKLDVRLTALPLAIKERYINHSSVLVPSQVEARFKSILKFITGYGIRYRLKRRPHLIDDVNYLGFHR